MLTLKAEQMSRPLSDFMGTTIFAVLRVAPVYAYIDGKKTDTVIGIKYTVANPDTFVNFDVKVSQTTPVITQEKVDASDERFWVTFTNAMVKPSKIEFGNVQCTVTADAARLDG